MDAAIEEKLSTGQLGGVGGEGGVVWDVKYCWCRVSSCVHDATEKYK